jgi:hypothetical protein
MGPVFVRLRNLAEKDGLILLKQFPAKYPFRHGRWITLAIAPFRPRTKYGIHVLEGIVK